MGFFSKFFKRRNIGEGTETDVDEAAPIQRANMDMTDIFQRERFTQNCLVQLDEASEELDKVTSEYNLVTSYLKDIEEIQSLPEHERNQLNACAKNIANLDENRKSYLDRSNRITEKQYNNMERLEDEMPSAYEKLKEYEIYQLKIKKDLKRIEGEKHAFQFRRDELKTGMDNLKGMTVICGGAVIACLLLLFILSFAFSLQTEIAFLITLVVAAITITVLFMKFREFNVEEKVMGNNINKVILLHNTVKIRYVNNTQIIDYLRLKFQVRHAKELKNLWRKYQEEKIARDKYEKTQDDLHYYRKELIKILRNYNIFDTNIWIFQVEAILDAREMVEIKHNLVVRRQALRKQMDYNKEIAEVAKKEVKLVVEKYPEYRDSTLALITRYEQGQQVL